MDGSVQKVGLGPVADSYNGGRHSLLSLNALQRLMRRYELLQEVAVERFMTQQQPWGRRQEDGGSVSFSNRNFFSSILTPRPINVYYNNLP